MYIPKQFKNEKQDEIIEFIRHNSFGVLFSQDGDQPTATHLPFLIKVIDESIILITHMAKANPQWKTLDGKRALAVFTGPHAYISASWYEEPGTVSTWNYVSAHAHGRVEILTDSPSLKEILRAATDFYEAGFDKPWEFEENEETVDSMLNGIVGIRLMVDKLEGKWKLNQHHPKERKEKVITRLKEQHAYDSQEIAQLMQDQMKD
ncbi:FMN-binding negative transcriptional regulator [Bacillus tianshenii]|uniref:FMN-binding negative transcriptional regulator n=1 Tax=Sutcliffiella tianshenii TaxID=1463404 RepID=UPI001CD45F99|nr:FMN-binding negative transcriptional regulator [Bacillus tianshenii]MCA1321161.1 FMN-binding negative transcriptional regulator [Bacillus tianshenii]